MMQLPEQGRSLASLKAELTARGANDAKWREGRTAVYVFNAGEDVAQVQKETYALYMSENGLAPRAFPSLKQMEDEVIAMSLGLLHGPDGACGAMASGGSESIVLAMKAARGHARANGKTQAGRTPTVVVPYSAHPAFDKAAALLDLEILHAPLGDDLRADVAAMSGLIDERTIALVGSLPCFPFGVMDPIVEIGAVAERHDLWLHVDACVGGYFAPFARMNGVDVPPFDFEVPAVKSISADLHKYGYAAKGASSILYRSEDLKAHMVFEFSTWPCGTMTTPTLAGTRPGGAIAAAWSVMNFLGVEGYREKQRIVTETREKLETGVRDLGFRVLGQPRLGLMAYASDELDMAKVWGLLDQRGWRTAQTVEPRAIHLMLSPYHAEVWQEYLADLEWARDQVRAGKAEDVTPTAVRYS